jgi:hypothetical protein
MIIHEMTTASLAVLPLTEFGLLEHGNMFRTRSNLHGVWLPKGESSDGRG